MIYPSMMKGGVLWLFRCQNIISPIFSKEQFIKAPDAKWGSCGDGWGCPRILSHTSMFPEYFKIQGNGFSGRKPHGFQRSDLPGWTSGSGRKPESQKGDKVILGRRRL